LSGISLGKFPMVSKNVNSERVLLLSLLAEVESAVAQAVSLLSFNTTDHAVMMSYCQRTSLTSYTCNTYDR
jgi:hypothetical protein